MRSTSGASTRARSSTATRSRTALASRFALSADGAIVAVGINGYNSDRGRVRVFAWDAIAGTWTQRGQDGQLDGVAGSDENGFSVALSDDGAVLAIGARGHNPSGATMGGLARVYEWKNNALWDQRGQDILGGANYDQLGVAVDLSADGAVLAVGDLLYGQYDPDHNERGRVTVYTYDAGADQWNGRGQELLGEANGDRGGWALQLSADGTVIVAGGKHNDPAGLSNAGHARVWAFDGAQDQWNQVGEDLDLLIAGAWHGYAVGISADATVVAVSAAEYPSTQGSVRVYFVESHPSPPSLPPPPALPLPPLAAVSAACAAPHAPSTVVAGARAARRHPFS